MQPSSYGLKDWCRVRRGTRRCCREYFGDSGKRFHTPCTPYTRVGGFLILRPSERVLRYARRARDKLIMFTVIPARENTFHVTGLRSILLKSAGFDRERINDTLIDGILVSINWSNFIVT